MKPGSTKLATLTDGNPFEKAKAETELHQRFPKSTQFFIIEHPHN